MPGAPRLERVASWRWCRLRVGNRSGCGMIPQGSRVMKGLVHYCGVGGMTVTPIRMAMTSPTVPMQQKSASRISNFSVASLLADTRPKTPLSVAGVTEVLLPANLSHASSSPRSAHDSSSIKNDLDRSDTPHSLLESDDYDSNQEDSIVDIEDINNDNSSSSPHHRGDGSIGDSKGSPGLLQHSAALAAAGHVPIRPTPFSALAAAAAAWGGMSGGGMPWPGAARQMNPFGPPGLFPGQGFGPGQLGGGECLS
ncbi:hypothetical protein pipiens_014313 [Culex pipiens pipiens]|uniref:Uncharacterized protein n=1 Tax=Culex pipiens pipiens TaxID=38569 RepID=A0ABD1CV49_CULPP